MLKIKSTTSIYFDQYLTELVQLEMLRYFGKMIFTMPKETWVSICPCILRCTITLATSCNLLAFDYFAYQFGGKHVKLRLWYKHQWKTILVGLSKEKHEQISDFQCYHNEADPMIWIFTNKEEKHIWWCYYWCWE